jgi:dipeptidyl aminopeptidase/acylaminoacyl peptidase
MRKTSSVVGLCVFLSLAGFPALVRAQALKPPLKLKDVLAWKHIGMARLSDDGRWLAYWLLPNEGDATVVLRRTRGDKEMRFPVGEARFGGALAFSEDSKWLGFTVYPSAKEAGMARGQRRPVQTKAALVELATGKKVEFDGVRRLAFAGEAGGWVALHRYPPVVQAQGRPPAGPAGPVPTAAQAPGQTAEKWNGSDLILRELATGNELNVGNVAEFAFDKKGERLALVIDAQGKSGNGVQLRTMATAAVIPLDSGPAVYRGLAWTEKGDGLAVLKGVENKAYDEPVYSVLGFTRLAARTPRKIVYDPRSDKTFPAGMTVSPNAGARWTDDLGALLFGIHEAKKKEVKPRAADATVKAGGPLKGFPARRPQKGAAAETEKPDLVIWHWADRRLQSQQQVEAGRDKLFNYSCLYRVKKKGFLRLADADVRQVTVLPKQRWALGYDRRAYALSASLDGRRYQDVYVIDLATGARRLALKKNRWSFTPSPDGTHLLYYDDGHFYTLELATGKTCNITRDVPTSFVNDESDHNVVKPPRFPTGWTKDGASVLLSDGWDVWNVPVHGGKGVNLTASARKDQVRYVRPFVLDPEAKGIDLAGPVYFSTYGEWTKKAGIARVDGGKAGAEPLLWEDAAFAQLLKAKKADVFLYTRETYKDYPDYYVTDKSLRAGRRLTQANPQQEKFAWSGGSMLVTYTNAKGVKLQGALYLPANYEKHKRYPTVVYIYEKLSQGLNHYWAPAVHGFSKSVYTSNGYAVFMPDIVYQVNDPGRSAVGCVLPALEAAIATGVVDRERVALHGHSWGGYQTAFVITQTDAFKAAVAGAPLTNLVSMYSSIYWNTGWANQPIFESSQGRFTCGYWDNWEAYIRNSPIYFAKNVKTPLLLLHNDKDGAVNWNQGIEYFNTLRRLGKPVVMLQYKGENHGLAKPANQKDYTVRMREFFDHYLRDKPAPAWLKEGVPHLRLEEHIRERVRLNGD